MASNGLLLFAALVLDRLVGDPPWLWRRIPHPVVLFGAAIGLFDRLLNVDGTAPVWRRLAGLAAIIALLAATAAAGLAAQTALRRLGLAGMPIEIAVVAVFLAQKSLSDHVAAVAGGLRHAGLEGGRKAVSMIVGRDPQALDEPGVCRAAIESLAENFADGVVAPAFWYLLFGLPGLLAYKLLNTADSMIGHRTARYLHFGWASARLDDLANWPAARISALLIALGGFGLAGFGRSGWRVARGALSAALRDHGLHRSVNSGWPEAAMAGALDLQLAGPRRYRGEVVSEPMINAAGRPGADVGEIDRALVVFAAACSLTAALALAVAALALLHG